MGFERSVSFLGFKIIFRFDRYCSMGIVEFLSCLYVNGILRVLQINVIDVGISFQQILSRFDFSLLHLLVKLLVNHWTINLVNNSVILTKFVLIIISFLVFNYK